MAKISLLATRPNHDLTTRYISAWAEDVLAFGTQHGHTVFDLASQRANRKTWESMMEKNNPNIVFLNGHGNDKEVTGQDNETLVATGDNETIFKNKIVYALSCKSAKVLGVDSVRAGAKAYIGYQDDFIFYHSLDRVTRPKEDKTAALFLEPSNQVAVSLLKGHGADEAKQRGKESFVRNMRKFMTSQTPQSDTSVLTYLFWNMQNLVCHK